MLQSITVSNIAVVRTTHVDLATGLNVFTGETGAGKSVLLDALAFGLGSRAQTTLIRKGADEASVTLVFEIQPPYAFLEHFHIPVENNTLIIRRSMTKDGKGKCFVNDTMITVSGLKAIGENLIEIHGQFDRLLSPTHHRMALDNFGALGPFVLDVKNAYRDWIKAEKHFTEAKEALQKNQENKDYIEFCVEELNRLNPQASEEETLLQKRSLSRHKEKIQTALSSALIEFRDKGQIESTFKNAYRFLQQGNVDDQLSSLIEQVNFLLIETQEMIGTLENMSESFIDQSDTISLDAIEQRLYSLRALAKKHHCMPDDLPDLCIKLQQDLNNVVDGEGSLGLLEKQAKNLKEAYREKALKLNNKRKEAAVRLEERVNQELPPLKLQAQLRVHFQDLIEAQWSEHGVESIEFFVSTNPGEPLGPLSKVASGGELSRIMLALKVILNQNTQVPTLIFDEIDTGTGGAVADAMGKRLHDLSKSMQVLVVTHSPQVASYGDHHYHVSKSLDQDRMQTTIYELKHQERIEEVARMLSGSTITDEAKAAAKKLLKDLVS
jgi:DNA repair protein RecN (Recombination protein N)